MQGQPTRKEKLGTRIRQSIELVSSDTSPKIGAENPFSPLRGAVFLQITTMKQGEVLGKLSVSTVTEGIPNLVHLTSQRSVRKHLFALEEGSVQ